METDGAKLITMMKMENEKLQHILLRSILD